MQTSPHDKKGFTLVWEGKPSEFITVIRLWSVLSDDFLKVESADNSSNITLWVTNEWIDWQYYRTSNAYQPVNTNNTRRVYDDKDFDALNKAMKAKKEHNKQVGITAQQAEEAFRTIEDNYGEH